MFWCTLCHNFKVMNNPYFLTGTFQSVFQIRDFFLINVNRFHYHTTSYSDAYSLSYFLLSGGPGSKKGKMVYNIAQVFGFNTLNVENIILEELAKKIEEPDPSRLTAQVQQLIKVSRNVLIKTNSTLYPVDILMKFSTFSTLEIRTFSSFLRL